MKMTTLEEFDGSMIYCMKTVLSYYEKKKDRILADYLYHLAIPLIVKIPLFPQQNLPKI